MLRSAQCENKTERQSPSQTAHLINYGVHTCRGPFRGGGGVRHIMMQAPARVCPLKPGLNSIHIHQLRWDPAQMGRVPPQMHPSVMSKRDGASKVKYLRINA